VTELRAAIAKGREQRLQGRVDDAIATFAEAHRRFPAEPKPLVERGAALVLTHAFDRALADYEEAERLDPDYPGLRSYFAEVLLYLGRATEALALSEQGLQVEPLDLMHRINRAHSLLFLGRADEALEGYRSLAAERHPGKRRSGAELVLEDFRLMRAAGLSPAGMGRAEAELAAMTLS
jgi:tetratricopeptide (TPR) repeat protein